MKLSTILASVALVAFVGTMLSFGQPSPPATAPATPAATLQRIDENRFGKVDPKYMSTGHSESTALLLKITGLSFKPTGIGKPVITEIKDDAGTDLMKSTTEGWTPMVRDSWQKIYSAPADNSTTYTLNIGRSPRKATKLVIVKGTISIIGGGEAKETTVKGAAAMIGKTVDHDDFKKMGVTLTVAAPPDFLKGQAIPFDVIGPSDAITEMQLLGADGKSQPASFGRTPLKDKPGEQLTIAGGKVDDTMSVTIKYVVGQQKVTIPFEYKDIPLP